MSATVKTESRLERIKAEMDSLDKEISDVTETIHSNQIYYGELIHKHSKLLMEYNQLIQNI